MKRLTAIFLLVLLIYYSVGYYFLFEWNQRNARAELHQSMDGTTQSGKDWFLLTVPMGWYHQTNRSPEPVEGEFSYKGRIYEKVIQRITNDTLFVYCVNNSKQEKVLDELKNHLKIHLFDLDKKDQKQNHQNFQAFIKQFYISGQPLKLSVRFIQLLTPDLKPFLLIHYSSCYLNVITPPPRYFLPN